MRFSALTLLLVMFLAATAHAETVAVSVEVAEIRSSPSSVTSSVLVLAPRYYPLSLIGAQGEFYKVSDYRGNAGWIPKSQIDNTRSVIVNVDHANIRQEPTTSSPVVFTAREGVAFMVTEESGNWLRVQHEGGASGWIFRELLWGD